MNIIEIKELTKYYGKSVGVAQLTFSVEEGEIFGFIGPNGAGKSTTIRTLLNFLFPTSGAATIFGFDSVKESKEIRKHVGYLPSEVHYYDDMRVLDLFQYTNSFYEQDCMPEAKRLADILELDTSRKIEDLSFGNKKKVGIVQAMMHNPKLLIMDEPTAGLDPLMQHVFFDLLKEARQEGATIFFSSHYLGEVQSLCDRVAIIKNGRLIKIEQMDSLRQNQFKKIKVTKSPDYIEPIRLEGALQEHESNDHYECVYNGDISYLLKQLANVPLIDISIEEPSLEEIFLHYYEKEGRD